MHRSGSALALLIGLVAAIAAGDVRATDVGVAARKLIVIDKTVLASSAKVVYVAKDKAAGITKGAATDAADISAQLDFAYVGGGASGSFAVPTGAFTVAA